MVDVMFDIGRVLVALQPERLLDLLRTHGASVRTLEDVTSRIDLTGHETGRLSGSELLQQIAALAPQPMAVRALEEAWVDIFQWLIVLEATRQTVRVVSITRWKRVKLFWQNNVELSMANSLKSTLCFPKLPNGPTREGYFLSTCLVTVLSRSISRAWSKFPTALRF